MSYNTYQKARRKIIRNESESYKPCNFFLNTQNRSLTVGRQINRMKRPSCHSNANFKTPSTNVFNFNIDKSILFNAVFQKNMFLEKMKNIYGPFLGDYNHKMKRKIVTNLDDTAFDVWFLNLTKNFPIVRHVIKEWILYKYEKLLCMPHIIKVILTYGYNRQKICDLIKNIYFFTKECGINFQTKREVIFKYFNNYFWSIFSEWAGCVSRKYRKFVGKKYGRTEKFSFRHINNFEDEKEEFSNNLRDNTLIKYSNVINNNAIHILHPLCFLPDLGSVRRVHK